LLFVPNEILSIGAFFRITIVYGGKDSDFEIAFDFLNWFDAAKWMFLPVSRTFTPEM